VVNDKICEATASFNPIHLHLKEVWAGQILVNDRQILLASPSNVPPSLNFDPFMNQLNFLLPADPAKVHGLQSQYTPPKVWRSRAGAVLCRFFVGCHLVDVFGICSKILACISVCLILAGRRTWVSGR
jgi:hypothetical protein